MTISNILQQNVVCTYSLFTQNTQHAMTYAYVM